MSRLPARVLLPSGERPAPTEAAAETGAGRSPPGCRSPRHAPQASLRAHLVAKTFRPMTKNSAIAKAVALFLAGAEGLVSPADSGAAPQWGAPSTDRSGSRDRRWTQPTGLQVPTTRTAGEPAGAPCCQGVPPNDKKQRHCKCLSLFFGRGRRT